MKFPSDNGTDNTYDVTVQASDGGDDTTAMQAVTIEVINVEEPGTVMLSTLQPQVDEPITATLTDPDAVTQANADDTVSDATWQWYRGNSEIAGATQLSYTPRVGDIGSVLRATATYRDAEDTDNDKTAQEDSVHAVRQAPESNVPPTFPTPVDQENTNQTREVAENTPAGTTIGAPVAASDTDVLTYSLNDTSAASFDINRATGQLITKVALDHEGTPEYTDIMVKATDPFGAEIEAQVTITVTDVNEAPTVSGDASIDHAESIASEVAALGADPTTYTASDVDAADPDTALKWSLSGADASKFNISPTTGATSTLSFKANPDYESPGDSGGNNVYEVTLVVRDSKGNSDDQDVTVKVTNINEDGIVTLSTLQPRVGFSVRATLTDPDNIATDSVSWQWYNGTIDTGDLTENAIEDATSATYTPMADDIGDTLMVRVTYTDGHTVDPEVDDVATVAAANTVLVDTRNNAPEFPDQDGEMEGRQTAQERTILENTASPMDIGEPVTATDEDTMIADNRPLTYSLGGPDAASFDIVRSSGQLQTKAELDKETKDTYTVTVTATDSLSASSTITVTIKVENVDELPDLEGEAPEEYAENGTRPVTTFAAVDPEGEAIVWSLDDADMDEFTIENGVLRFKSPPDYEDTDNDDHMYVVTVQASDGGATPAMKPVTIEITNVEEPGTVTLTTLQPQVLVSITATLADPDTITTPGTISWQWYRGSNPISGAINGVGTTTSAYSPAAGDVGSILRARATYRDAEDIANDKTAQQVSYRSVRRAPETNTDPLFPDQDPNMEDVQSAQDREVAENTPTGTDLGAPVTATDSGDVLTYSLDTGADATAFSINRATGQLSTKAELDYEDTTNGDHKFTVTVTAADPFGDTDMSVVTILVTDVNEDPMVAGAASIDHVEGDTELDTDAATVNVEAATYTVTDADDVDDANDLAWSLTGADASKFEFASPATGATRTLAFKANPDYESPGDSGGNNVYEVTVKVTDSKGNSDEQDVTIKVTNMEELGVVTLSTLQPRVGFSVTATLTDPDNITADSVSWQWYKGSVALGNFATILECDDDTNNIDDCAIEDATSDTYTPVTDDVGDTLSAVATYIDGSPNEGDMKDAVVQPAAQQVLADTRNKAPVFPDQDMEMEGRQTDQELMIGENVPAIGGVTATILVREIGTRVIAMDFIIAADSGDQTDEILTYSLGGPDADSFSIDRVTAQLSTKAVLDYETKDTYTVMVTATDPSGESATVMVTIKVTNVDEAPTIMVGGLAISGLRNVRYAENGTGMVATYVANGPNAASARWSSLEGPDAGDFTFSGGVLTFRSSPDYEMPADADTNNIYMVTLKADDGTDMATQDVTVRVTDVDEQGQSDSLLERYDTNDNGRIDKDEVLTAISDYFNQVGGLTKPEVLEIIRLYFNR